MKKVCTINIEIDRHDKEVANNILKKLGLNMNTYINMAIKELIIEEKIPFEVPNQRPTKELLEALKEGEDILSGKVKAKKYTNMYELVEDILKED